MHWLTWFGLLLIAVGTGFTIWGQQIMNSKSTRLLENKTDKITELSQENIRLSSELSKINQEIAATVTGGESFCYLFPSPSFGKTNAIDFHLQHKGEYPVYDVSMRIWDETGLKAIDHGQIFQTHLGYRTKEVTLEEWQKMKVDPEFILQSKKIESDIKEQMREYQVLEEKLGTITPNTSINVMDPPLLTCTLPAGTVSSKYRQEYSVSIAARNGQYNQKITLSVRNKRYHIASTVERVVSGSKRVVVREYESQDSDGFVIKLIK